MPHEWRTYPDVTQMWEFMLFSVGIVGVLVGVVSTLGVQAIISTRNKPIEQKKGPTNDPELIKALAGALAFQIASEMPTNARKDKYTGRFSLTHDELKIFQETLRQALLDNQIDIMGHWSEKGRTFVEYKRID